MQRNAQGTQKLRNAKEMQKLRNDKAKQHTMQKQIF